MTDAIAHVIRRQYPHAAKIVEVGVGHRPQTARQLAEALPHAEVWVTDVDPACLEAATGPVRLLLDDVQAPSLPYYWGADLVYAVHPPPELIPSLERLVDFIGSPLLVAPLAEDVDAVASPTWRPIAVAGRRIGWIRPAPSGSEDDPKVKR